MSLEAEYFAVIDKQKEEDRLCYASPALCDPSTHTMAIYDKKPTIPKEWRDVKKIVKVKIQIIDK